MGMGALAPNVEELIPLWLELRKRWRKTGTR